MCRCERLGWTRFLLEPLHQLSTALLSISKTNKFDKLVQMLLVFPHEEHQVPPEQPRGYQIYRALRAQHECPSGTKGPSSSRASGPAAQIEGDPMKKQPPRKYMATRTALRRYTKHGSSARTEFYVNQDICLVVVDNIIVTCMPLSWVKR